MSKRMTKVLSMILTLVMFLSVSTPAFAWGNIGIGDGWDRDIGEDEVRDFDVDVEEEKEEYDYFSTFDEETGINVTVEAPMGALPTLAEVRVEPVDPEAVREAVDSVTEGEREILLAMDISFWLENDEIEPEEPVRVRIAAPELEGRSDLTVVHIPDEEEPESIDLITDENDLKFELGTNEICFESGDFSIYAVVGDDVISDSSRLTVNFIRKIGDEGTIITTVYVKNGDKYLENEEARVEGESYINDIVFDPGLGEGYNLGSNMFRGWTIDAADANPQPEATEDDPNPAPIPYGANYDRNTKVYTIDDIDKFLAEKRVGNIAEGDVLNIYAMIFQTYTISYFGASTDVSMGMHTVFAPLNENAEAPYTIDMTYTPEDNQHFFEGWLIMDGKENIVSAVDPQGNPINGPFVDISEQNLEADPPVKATVFPNGSKLVVKGSVQFSVSQPAGRWLIFKENGKGATYNAPQFVKSGENTFLPTNAQDDNMVRNGYEFLGWYEVETTMENGRAVPKTDPTTGEYVFKSSSPFQFGNPLPQETVIAAKWQVKSSSQYTVVIWRQNVACDGYDFAESITLTGTPNTEIPTSRVNYSGTLGDKDAYLLINNSGTAYRGTDGAYEKNPNTANPYCGFHLQNITYGPNGKNINPEGNTVVNVYYDRNEYTLEFQIEGYVYTPTTGNSGTQYGLVDGEYVQLTRRGNNPNYYWTYDGDEYRYVYTATTSNDGTQFGLVNGEYVQLTRHNSGSWLYPNYYWTYGNNITYTGTRYTREYTNRVTYTGTRYTRTNGWAPVKTITAKFGQDISGNFPIIGSNGTTYNNGERWDPQTNDAGWAEVMVYIDTMPSCSVAFHLDVADRPLKTINYYVEALPDDENQISAPATLYDTNNNPVTTNKSFVLYHKVDARYQGVTIEDIISLPGFSVIGMDKQKDGNGRWIWNANNDTLNVYYSRDLFVINYEDGIYVDGNNNPVDEQKQSGFGQSPALMYGSDISSYNKGGANYMQPTRNGYVFEGWYLDDGGNSPATFTTMPRGGITVYAKWRKVQYRVFLRTNVPTSDGSLDWGSEDQSMNFRITEGDYVSLPTGTRNGYIFVGWYYDEDFDDAFNSEVVPLTSDNVTDDYDKTARLYMTDNAKMITKPDGTQDNKPINKWGFLDDDDAGINKDVKRFWITNKLDLYAKWKAVLDGAEGISVLYDEVPKGDDANASGHGVTGSAPTDGNRLYEDKSKAIAQPASTALAEDEHFLYWVVQTWDKTANNGEGAYVDVKVDGDIIKVYPGDNFMVRADYARITPDPDHAGKNFYTVQLRAAYGKKDGPEPTHIKWYSNIYDVAGNQFIDTETKGDMNHPTNATWNENGGWYIQQENVQINNAVPIPTPPYSMEGYTFLGWGRVCDPDSVPEGGKAYVTDPSTLTKEDLYIKWVPAANNIPAHYEAMLPAAAASGNVVPGNTRADGEELTWQTVQYVAADEQKPYHDMYAIWGGEFKVYHSGIEGGAVETYSLSRDNKTFDLTRYYTNTRAGGDEHTGEYKDAGFLYGGYYLEGGFKPAAYTEKTVGEGDAQKTIYIPTSTCAAYDGANWTWTTPVTDQPGNAITPKGGVTYYIKEVPADKYLQPYFHYTYKKIDGNPIVTAWLISDIDDETYRETGFVIETADGQATVCSSLTVQNATNGNTVKLTPKRVFGSTGLTGGFLTYRRVIEEYAGLDHFGDGATIKQYWVTPDGLIVTGTTSRVYTGTAAKDSVACTASTNAYSIAKFETESLPVPKADSQN